MRFAGCRRGLRAVVASSGLEGLRVERREGFDSVALGVARREPRLRLPRELTGDSLGLQGGVDSSESLPLGSCWLTGAPGLAKPRSERRVARVLEGDNASTRCAVSRETRDVLIACYLREVVSRALWKT